jgi:hypothetical protein
VDDRRPPAPAAWAAATVGVTLGALIGAVLLAPRSAAPGAALALLVFVGSSVHVAASAWLVTLTEVRAQARLHPFRFLWCPVLLIGGATGAAMPLPPHVLSRLLLVYFAWQLWHYQRQNLGFVALAARSSGVTGSTTKERRVIMVAGGAGVVGLVSRPAALQLGVSGVSGVSSWAWPLAVGALGASIVIGIWLLIRRPSSDRSPALVGVTVMTLVFPLPLFVFTSPFASIGGMTIAHGLQYLVFVGAIAAGNAGPGRRVTGVAAMVVIALTFGAALATASHLHGGGAATRSIYGAYLGLVMTHFVIDAGTWRLRDPIPRRLLARCVPSLLGYPDRRVGGHAAGTHVGWADEFVSANESDRLYVSTPGRAPD